VLGRAGRSGQGVEAANRMAERTCACRCDRTLSCGSPRGATAQPALLGQYTSSSSLGDRPSAPALSRS